MVTSNVFKSEDELILDSTEVSVFPPCPWMNAATVFRGSPCG